MFRQAQPLPLSSSGIYVFVGADWIQNDLSWESKAQFGSMLLPDFSIELP